MLLLASLTSSASFATTDDVLAIAITAAPMLEATCDLRLDERVDAQIAQWLEAIGVQHQLGAEWRQGDPDWQRARDAFARRVAEARGAFLSDRYVSLLAERLRGFDSERAADLRRLLAGRLGAEILHNERDLLFLSAAMADDPTIKPGSTEWLDRMDALAERLHRELPDPVAEAAHAAGTAERQAYERGALHDSLQNALTSASRRAFDEVTTGIALHIDDQREALERELQAAVDSFRSPYSK